MKTPEEWEEVLVWSDCTISERVQFIKAIQQNAYNQAIEDASKVDPWTACGEEDSILIRKIDILELKKL